RQFSGVSQDRGWTKSPRAEKLFWLIVECRMLTAVLLQRRDAHIARRDRRLRGAYDPIRERAEVADSGLIRRCRRGDDLIRCRGRSSNASQRKRITTLRA